MFKSARCSNKRERERHVTLQRINGCARGLTEERGLDGFTMEDLAAAAGVSRRTLFNYFPGKLDAVLGPWPELDPDAVATFRAGGPEHDLVSDLRTLVVPLLESDLAARDRLAEGHRVLRSEPRLLAALQGRYEQLSAEVVRHIAAREGPAFQAQRARVAVNLLAAIFDSAWQDAIEDPHERPVLIHFDRALTTARSLLGS
ncbi:MAG TPA: TetR family transcriptional regulator [Ornithinimicrobium sp.]|uniref:TetR/AcrR family transcriptional regulator n=1 Tax=Ornithinimicrobium sp. TaxID=1977084 RepID=UPI002B49A174|nr:TetR family transcriptional regulator [Ornithinimicrobium sp.]HKJ12911.1 TetR family transcriptional regulator [Ornithinimicrobium sp.]